MVRLVLWMAGILVGALGVRLVLGLRGPSGPARRLAELRAAGCPVVDVRTPMEFAQGHPDGALNIPLDELPARAAELDPHRALIVCCASGGRSAQARRMLEARGFQGVVDAGPWTRLVG